MKKINLQGTQDYAVTTTDGDVSLTAGGAGKSVKIGGLSYPGTDGAADQVIKTDGAGNLSFGDASGGASVVEKPFRPKVIERFGKGDGSPFSNHSGLAFMATTAHSPDTDTIMNVFPANRQLTFFRVGDTQLTKLSSETTTLTSGTVSWVDFSGDGLRAVICLKQGGADQMVVLSTSDNWVSYVVEQTITLSDVNENIVNAALNSDGSILFYATGNEAANGTVNPNVSTYTRSVTTWSFGETIYNAGAAATKNMILMQGQQSDTVVGFQEHDVTSTYSASLHIYQDTGTWGQIWTKAAADIGGSSTEAKVLSSISADGDVVFYKTSGTSASVDIGVLTSPTTVGTSEGLAGNDAVFLLSADGHTVIYNTDNQNDGRIWMHYIDGTNMEEIGFGSFNYEINRPYGMQQHVCRPSKTGHYYMVGNNSGTYTDDALFAGVPVGSFAGPGSGCIY